MVPVFPQESVPSAEVVLNRMHLGSRHACGLFVADEDAFVPVPILCRARRVGCWLNPPPATAGWACLIILGGPDDGGHYARLMIVIIGAVLAVMSMTLYLCTACTDPGIVFKHRARRATSAGAGSSAGVSGGDRNFALPASAAIGGAAVSWVCTGVKCTHSRGSTFVAMIGWSMTESLPRATVEL